MQQRSAILLGYVVEVFKIITILALEANILLRYSATKRQNNHTLPLSNHTICVAGSNSSRIIDLFEVFKSFHTSSSRSKVMTNNTRPCVGINCFAGHQASTDHRVWIRGSRGFGIFRQMRRRSSILLGDELEAFNYCYTASGSKIMTNTLFGFERRRPR